MSARKPAPKHVTIRLSAAEMPGPGEMAELTWGSYSLLIENTADPAEEQNVGHLVKYVVVDTEGNSTRTHAAAVYQGTIRTRRASYTVCSRNNSRKVTRRRDAEPISNVTCVQCRKHLEDEGEI